MATYQGTGDVWYCWTSTSATTSSASTTGNDYVWGQWNGTSTTTWDSNTTGDACVWRYWVQESPGGVVTYIPTARRQDQQPEPVVVPDYRAIEERRAKAEARALDMLVDLIGEEQAAVYRETGVLVVKGREHDWLIERDTGRVYRLTKGKVQQLCVHSEKRGQQPVTDNVVALALHAKFAECELVKKANKVGDPTKAVELFGRRAANF